MQMSHNLMLTFGELRRQTDKVKSNKHFNLEFEFFLSTCKTVSKCTSAWKQCFYLCRYEWHKPCIGGLPCSGLSWGWHIVSNRRPVLILESGFVTVVCSSDTCCVCTVMIDSSNVTHWSCHITEPPVCTLGFACTRGETRGGWSTAAWRPEI